MNDETMALDQGSSERRSTATSRLQQVLDNSSALVFAKDRTRPLPVRQPRVRARHRLRRGREMLGRTDDEVFPARARGTFPQQRPARAAARTAPSSSRRSPTSEAARARSSPRSFRCWIRPALPTQSAAWRRISRSASVWKRRSRPPRSPFRSPRRRRSTVSWPVTCATNLGVDGAFIATTEQGDGRSMRMLAFHLDGEVLENFAYPIAGTPCETVIGQQYRIYLRA